MIKLVITALILQLLGSCATSVRELKKLPLKAQNSPLVLMTYTSVEDLDLENCKSYFKELYTKKEYYIDFNTESGNLLFELPFGVYRLVNISCRNREFRSKTSVIPFKVLKRGINFIGHFDFTLSREGGLISNINYDQRKAVRIMKDEFSLDDKVSIWSAYSGREITNNVLALRPKGLKNDICTEVSCRAFTPFPDFVNCFESEEKINPFIFGRLGELKIKALYSKRKLLKLNLKNRDHVYTDKFVKCVKKEIKLFKPNVASKLNYTFSI